MCKVCFCTVIARDYGFLCLEDVIESDVDAIDRNVEESLSQLSHTAYRVSGCVSLFFAFENFFELKDLIK